MLKEDDKFLSTDSVKSDTSLKMTRARLLVIAACFLAIASASSAPTRNITWSNAAADGKWETAANWNLPGIPDSYSYNYFISNGQPCALSSSRRGNNATISSGNTFNILPSGYLFHGGPALTNDGAININPNKQSGNCAFVINNVHSAVIQGSGSINLNGSDNAGETAALALGCPVTLAAGQLVRGQGQIEPELGAPRVIGPG